MSTLDFQICEWVAEDEETVNVDDGEETQNKQDYTSEATRKDYVIRLFGRARDQQPVTVTVRGFLCYYYVKVHGDWNKQKLRTFIAFVQNYWGLRKRHKDALVVEKCSLVQKLDLYGYKATKDKFVKLVFNGHRPMLTSRYMFKRAVHIPGVTKSETRFELYESNIEPFTRFAISRKILMCGWVRVKTKSKPGSTGYDIQCRPQDIDNISSQEQVQSAPFLQASWDIETMGLDPKVYPVIQIATTFKHVGNPSVAEYVHIVTLKECAPIETTSDGIPVIVESCATEAELLIKWAEFIKSKNPDILYTYNGDKFDGMYVHARADLLGVCEEFASKLSRIPNKPAYMVCEQFSSSAYGDQKYERLIIPGRLGYDLLIHMRRSEKFEGYKLNTVAQIILKDSKVDLAYKKMFELYTSGSPEDIRTIAVYCIQDTVLLQRIVDRKCLFPGIVQLSNVTCVPIKYLVTRGQTIKVLNQIVRKCDELGYAIPHTAFNNDEFETVIYLREEFKEMDRNQRRVSHVVVEFKFDKEIAKLFNQDFYKGVFDVVRVQASGHQLVIRTKSEVISKTRIDCSGTVRVVSAGNQSAKSWGISGVSRVYESDDYEDSYTGAKVLDPITGFYQDPVVVLDFASLYPTIMMAHNLCFSTFVLPGTQIELPPGATETFEWTDTVAKTPNGTCEAIVKATGAVCGKPAKYVLETGALACGVHDTEKKSRDPDSSGLSVVCDHNYTVVKSHVRRGVVPMLLEELYQTRKDVKAEMNRATNDEVKNILNAQQLAIKISLNSIYGFFGRTFGNLTLKEIAGIVTYVGRGLIGVSKRFAEEQFVDRLGIRDRNKEYIHVKSGLNESQLDEKLQEFLV